MAHIKFLSRKSLSWRNTTVECLQREAIITQHSPAWLFLPICKHNGVWQHGGCSQTRECRTEIGCFVLIEGLSCFITFTHVCLYDNKKLVFRHAIWHDVFHRVTIQENQTSPNLTLKKCMDLRQHNTEGVFAIPAGTELSMTWDNIYQKQTLTRLNVQPVEMLRLTAEFIWTETYSISCTQERR